MENNSENRTPLTKYDLLLRPVGRIRHKALGTLVKKRKISYEAARKLQAQRILEKDTRAT